MQNVFFFCCCKCVWVSLSCFHRACVLVIVPCVKRTIHNFAAYRWYTTTTYDIILPFYQQIAKPKDMALKLLRCVRLTCEIQIPPDDTVNGLNPGVTCRTVV